MAPFGCRWSTDWNRIANATGGNCYSTFRIYSRKTCTLYALAQSEFCGNSVEMIPCFQCLPHAWYLSIDTQLFIFAPLIVHLLYRCKWKVLIVVFLAIAVSMGITLHTYFSHEDEAIRWSFSNTIRCILIVQFNSRPSQQIYGIAIPSDTHSDVPMADRCGCGLFRLSHSQAATSHSQGEYGSAILAVREWQLLGVAGNQRHRMVGIIRMSCSGHPLDARFDAAGQPGNDLGWSALQCLQSAVVVNWHQLHRVRLHAWLWRTIQLVFIAASVAALFPCQLRHLFGPN